MIANFESMHACAFARTVAAIPAVANIQQIKNEAIAAKVIVIISGQ
jgi:hypothetical protein